MSFANTSLTFLKLITIIAFLSAFAFGQGQERLIDKMSWRTEPIKILKLETKGKQIELGKKFIEDDDWLKGLTITVKNVSDKAIARIELHLEFLRPEGTPEDISTYVASMGYGRDPADEGAEPLKLVQPGEIVDVKLLEINLPFIRSDLKTLGYPDKITRVQLRVEYITFVDGSMWSGDDILYPDPANPRRKNNPRSPPIRGPSSGSKPSLSLLGLSSSSPFTAASFTFRHETTFKTGKPSFGESALSNC